MLSALHLYPKTHRDLVEKTRIGGLVSLVALGVMGVLFFTELQAYLSSRFETTLTLDDNNDQALLIDFKLDLPKLPCHVVTVEVSDVFGTHKMNSASNVFKHKLDAEGVRGDLVGGSVSSTTAGRGMAATGKFSLLPTTPPADESDFEKSPLAPADFDAAVESFDLVLVNFFAPWCPHCIRFAPIWAEAGRLLDESPYADRVVLAKLDCNEHEHYCAERHSIDRFPTVRAYANGGAEMVNYAGNLGEASAIVSYVKMLMETKLEVAAEAERHAPQLTFAVNESVQVWFHNGWRDAHVTSRVSEAELAALEEGQEAREYKVRFNTYQPPEGSPRHGHPMMIMFGGTIMGLEQGTEDEDVDHHEHEVSVHIMRPKPSHKGAFKTGERVQVTRHATDHVTERRLGGGLTQHWDDWTPGEPLSLEPLSRPDPHTSACPHSPTLLLAALTSPPVAWQLRVAAGWVPAQVVDTRPVTDAGTNCTAWQADGWCRSHPTQMLTQCAKTCHASSHPTEYKVRTELSTRWATHERLLPENAVLHVTAHAEATEGCELSGQLMVSRVPGSVQLKVDGHAHAFNVKATNLTHAVRHLSFGYSDRRRNWNLERLSALALPPSLLHARTPLDGARFASERSHESHMHYLKVIRTTLSLLGQAAPTDMYHFTSASSTMTHHGSPAITFSYDLSPMQVLVAEETEGLFRFVVYCFAILGGGFTVFGLLDGVLFHGSRLLREKVGLGKAA